MASLFHLPLGNLLGIITLAIWLHLFFGRGWFWRVNRLNVDSAPTDALGEWPSVLAIVPARNEAETIAEAVSSLAQQDYPGVFSIIVVDDHSDDITADLARDAAAQNAAAERFSLVSASQLPSGWTGKLWALNEGLTNSAALGATVQLPTFYWFTDADIKHSSDTLRQLVGRAERGGLDIASLMVMLQCRTLPERALIPAFLYFFLMLYPPTWTSDEDLATAGAAGGCILLRREALVRIGGLAAIRSEVIDDCALAKAVKSTSGKVWMGLTRKSTSLRDYKTFGEIRDLIARTAFTQLRYSALLLVGTLFGMLLTYIAPVALLLSHDSTARIMGFAAWLLMSASFLPTIRFYKLSPLCVPLLPLAALFYTFATGISALRYWIGKGGQWKGRAQAPGRT